MNGTASLPEAFTERLKQIIPTEYLPDVMRSFSIRRHVGVRMNTLLPDWMKAIEQFSLAGVDLQPIDWCPNAYVVNRSQRQLLVESDSFAERHIYIQNLSSLLPVVLLDPQPGEQILDLAAAPGGKTLHLAALMQNHGRISAVEVVRGRYFKLCDNLRTAGASIVRTYLKDGRAVGNKTPDRFDRVLIDAPCSSEARFRCDEPTTWQYWGPRKIREQARKQQGLLKSGCRALKPGGLLAYCTCSFAPEENELIIDRQLRRDDSIEVVQIRSLPLENILPALTCWEGKSLSPQLTKAIRVLPTESMDGFFICLLTKRET